MSATEEMIDVGALQAELAETRQARRAHDREYRDKARQLREREESLTRMIREARRPAPSRAGLDPHRQAGRHAEAALHALRRTREGRLTQAEIGQRASIGTGTLTHAMKALEQDGLVRRTGEFESRSPVFTLTPKGRRGLTRRRPGS